MICVDAFSPNGDGINDLLLSGRKITVFDRTQKILYQGWDGWDGRLNGREMPEGTYFYILFNEDNSVFCKTPVTLLRSSLAK
jgi:gliding motility-associated-like protein